MQYKQLRQCDACRRYICSSLNGVLYEKMDKRPPSPMIFTNRVNDTCEHADWECKMIRDINKANYEL